MYFYEFQIRIKLPIAIAAAASFSSSSFGCYLTWYEQSFNKPGWFIEKEKYRDREKSVI